MYRSLIKKSKGQSNLGSERDKILSLMGLTYISIYKTEFTRQTLTDSVRKGSLSRVLYALEYLINVGVRYA